MEALATVTAVATSEDYLFLKQGEGGLFLGAQHADYHGTIAACACSFHPSKVHTNCIRSRAALIFSSGSRLLLIKELLAAVMVVTIVFSLTIFEQQPFMTLIDLRTEIKDGRFSIHVLPPVADADRLTFEEFCLTAAIDKQKALQSARSHSIVIDNSFETIAEIAEKNHVSPEGIFKAIRDD